MLITSDCVFICIYTSVHRKHPFPASKFTLKLFLSIRIKCFVSLSSNSYLNFKLFKIIILSNIREIHTIKSIPTAYKLTGWKIYHDINQYLKVYILNLSFLLYIFEQLSENCEQLISFFLPKRRSSLQK